jgi:zinc transporter ZupT
MQLGYALPFSAGVTLYVAASDLIPEVNTKKKETLGLNCRFLEGLPSSTGCIN